MERPFFDVNVELKLPSVSMNPTLEAIQEAINSTAKTILQVRPARGWRRVRTRREGRTPAGGTPGAAALLVCG